MKTLTTKMGRGRVRAKIRTDRYFSLTGELYERSRRTSDPDYTQIDGIGYVMVGGGAMGDELVKIWPKLAPLNALHLSDIETGEPMHGLENGWYWLAGYMTAKGWTPETYGPTMATYPGAMTHTTEKCREYFARMMRVTPADVDTLADRLAPLDKAEGRAEFILWYRDQRPRFRAEALDALALINSL